MKTTDNHPASLFDWNYETNISKYYEQVDEVSSEHEVDSDGEVDERITSIDPFSSNDASSEYLLEPSKIHTMFNYEKQALFFGAHLKNLPGLYNSLLSNRLVVLHFSLVGLDILNVLDKFVDHDKRISIIDWIYNLQSFTGGFRGSPQMCSVKPILSKSSCPCVGLFSLNDSDSYFQENMGKGPDNIMAKESVVHSFEVGHSHLAATHSAMCSLLTLGDDLSKINRSKLGEWLRLLQQPDGGFAASVLCDEIDLRFSYCATLIAETLGLWDNINISSLLEYVLKCQTWEGGFSLRPNLGEAHGGATFTGVAILRLLERHLAQHLVRNPTSSLYHEKQQSLGNIKKITAPTSILVRWILQKQGSGYFGRVGKSYDTCYSYWLGASLDMLGVSLFSNPAGNLPFLQLCQGNSGGFGKDPKSKAEILHSYTSLCGISLAFTVDASYMAKAKNAVHNSFTNDGLSSTIDIDTLLDDDAQFQAYYHIRKVSSLYGIVKRRVDAFYDTTRDLEWK